MLAHDQKIIHSSVEANWRTPGLCFLALDRAFHFVYDLAADRESALCPKWLGPGGEAEDALVVDWTPLLHGEAGFLNPPYSKKEKQPIGPWLEKCWMESQKGCTIVGLIPFAPQTVHYTKYVYGFDAEGVWSGHAAMEEWRLPHRISYLRPDGSPAGNAGVNSVVIVWRPNPGFVGPWTPATRYWSYR